MINTDFNLKGETALDLIEYFKENCPSNILHLIVFSAEDELTLKNKLSNDVTIVPKTNLDTLMGMLLKEIT